MHHHLLPRILTRRVFFPLVPRAFPPPIHISPPIHTFAISYKSSPVFSTSTLPNMLTSSSAPLIWIDCEMTGLASHDVLLQLACFVTTPTLELLDQTGFETVIHRPQSTLDKMDEWCTRTHQSTGLTARVLASKTTVEEAGAALLEYIQRFVPEKGVGLLAGNSVHADKVFLVREMPEVVEWMHYRLLDVSSVKEAARRWCGEDVLRGVPKKSGVHEARMDILESIEEARYWKDVLFTPAKALGQER